MRLSEQTNRLVSAQPFATHYTSMYDARHKQFPALPKTIDEVEIPESLCITTRKERFLLDQDNKLGIIIIETNENP